MRTWTKVVSWTCASGFLMSERTPRCSFGIGGGRSSFFVVRDSYEATDGGRSGDMLSLIRVMLRVDTMLFLMLRIRVVESNVSVVAETGMSHENMWAFISE